MGKKRFTRVASSDHSARKSFNLHLPPSLIGNPTFLTTRQTIAPETRWDPLPIFVWPRVKNSLYMFKQLKNIFSQQLKFHESQSSVSIPKDGYWPSLIPQTGLSFSPSLSYNCAVELPRGSKSDTTTH